MSYRGKRCSRRLNTRTMNYGNRALESLELRLRCKDAALAILLIQKAYDVGYSIVGNVKILRWHEKYLCVLRVLYALYIGGA